MHRILLVDDNEAYIDSIKDILEDDGYLIKTANNGEAACDLIRQSEFDLVLMDIKMPGMNGVETFLKMKQHNPEVKVILFTAYALTDLIDQARLNGVISVLKKPLDFALLDRILEENLKAATGGYILIADDDRSLCENLAELLTDSGYHVAVAENGHAAIKEAQAQQFDILLLDMKMPQINGLETYRKIRQIQPDLITIIMTGYAEQMQDLVDRALEENAYTMLPKPIDISNLLEFLEKVTKPNA